LRVFQHDAVEVLRFAIADATLAEVRVFFPDPWPKKKHHKRRLIQPAFVDLLQCKLRPGGRLHLATDWGPYAEHMLSIMDAARGWRNAAGPGRYSDRPSSRPLTHFERRGLRLGHPVQDLIYEVLPE
jgi:tRNA (guanine-N7-)-methyltransferase